MCKPTQSDLSTEDMQAAFVSEQEQLRLAHLGLGRLTQIFEKGTYFIIQHAILVYFISRISEKSLTI